MRKTNTGILTLAAIGGYYLWRNRFEVQRFLEARGIHLPLSTRSVGDTIHSGVTKVTGGMEHDIKNMEHKTRKVG